MKKPPILILLAIIGIIGFVVISKSSIPAPLAPETQTPMPTINNSELKQGGSSLSDPVGVYSLLYPADYRFDSENEGTAMRIYKQGPTQRGQTEMYDGALAVFERIELGSLTMNEWVDAQISQASTDGISELVEAKKPIKLNNYSGFSYAVRGLGVSTYWVIQKDASSPYAVRISTLVSDPENVGFQKEVDMILSTLELHK